MKRFGQTTKLGRTLYQHITRKSMIQPSLMTSCRYTKSFENNFNSGGIFKIPEQALERAVYRFKPASFSVIDFNTMIKMSNEFGTSEMERLSIPPNRWAGGLAYDFLLCNLYYGRKFKREDLEQMVRESYPEIRKALIDYSRLHWRDDKMDDYENREYDVSFSEKEDLQDYIHDVCTPRNFQDVMGFFDELKERDAELYSTVCEVKDVKIVRLDAFKDNDGTKLRIVADIRANSNLFVESRDDKLIIGHREEKLVTNRWSFLHVILEDDRQDFIVDNFFM
mmetsp:Transcript_5824/g.8555  ORF Transcript_5824/g.8555 Transcript_5824/m.8555 type:complete len:280 (+) Transcript_5824:31-870(+)